MKNTQKWTPEIYQYALRLVYSDHKSHHSWI